MQLQRSIALVNTYICDECDVLHLPVASKSAVQYHVTELCSVARLCQSFANYQLP
jgi:hypothetical protein